MMQGNNRNCNPCREIQTQSSYYSVKAITVMYMIAPIHRITEQFDAM